MKTQEITRLLKRLIQICDHGELGFYYSAQHVKSKELSLILVSLADNCRQCRCALQKLLGGAVSPRSRASSALHRAKLTLRIIFTENVDRAILRECARMEEKIVSEYRAAMQKLLPIPVRELLERQYRGAKCNASRIHDLLVLQQVIGPILSRPKPYDTKTVDRQQPFDHAEQRAEV